MRKLLQDSLHNYCETTENYFENAVQLLRNNCDTNVMPVVIPVREVRGKSTVVDGTSVPHTLGLCKPTKRVGRAGGALWASQ